MGCKRNDQIASCMINGVEIGHDGGKSGDSAAPVFGTDVANDTDIADSRVTGAGMFP